MKSLHSILLLLSLIFISLINCQPAIINLNTLILDHYPDINLNFEPENYTNVIVRGLVKPSLNSTHRVPELKSLLKNDTSNQMASINDPNSFKYFFTPMADQNKAIQYLIPLYINSNGFYIYNNPSFFPIDYYGFDVISSFNKFTDKTTSKYHNYHFCLKWNLNFKLNKGNELFSIKTDNDVWVFINDKIAIDMGGFSNNTLGTISFNQLGLKIGGIYSIDLFLCQRNTFKSSLYIETNIEMFCPYYDQCGVCNGDGTSCLNKCNKCSGGLCVAKTSNDCGKEIDGENVDPCSEYFCDSSQGCYKKPKCQNPFNNKCQISTCQINNGKGECIVSFKPEIDDNNICTLDDCDPKTGTIVHINSKKCNK